MRGMLWLSSLNVQFLFSDATNLVEFLSSSSCSLAISIVFSVFRFLSYVLFSGSLCCPVAVKTCLDGFPNVHHIEWLAKCEVQWHFSETTSRSAIMKCFSAKVSVRFQSFSGWISNDCECLLGRHLNYNLTMVLISVVDGIISVEVNTIKFTWEVHFELHFTLRRRWTSC